MPPGKDSLQSVTVVTLSGEDCLGDLETLVGRDETDDIGEARVGRLHRAVDTRQVVVRQRCARETVYTSLLTE